MHLAFVEPQTNGEDYEMPYPGVALQVPTRYPPWVNLSLSVYQVPSPEKFRRREKDRESKKRQWWLS